MVPLPQAKSIKTLQLQKRSLIHGIQLDSASTSTRNRSRLRARPLHGMIRNRQTTLYPVEVGSSTLLAPNSFPGIV
jgi:hypothetical protein